MQEINKKSDTVQREFVETIPLDGYQVWTDEGWVDIEAVHRTVDYDVYELKTAGHTLSCADDHIVFDGEMQETFVKELAPGDFVMTEDGPEEVVSVRRAGDAQPMYDLQLAEDSSHRFFVEGILSHNSSCYCMYVLWLTCFHPDKRVMMMAQKEATALELLDRIKTGYTYLPSWLKPGCVEFNKSSVKFSNRSTVMGYASSSQGARGQSCNCVTGDTVVTLRSSLLKSARIDVRIGNLAAAFSMFRRQVGRNGQRDTVHGIGTQLHETVSREYSKSFRVFGVEVRSADGRWERVTSVNVTEPQETVSVMAGGLTITCAKDHVLMLPDGSETFAKDALGKTVVTDLGPKTVTSVCPTGRTVPLYDLSLADGSHTYFTNGILSHNCLILDEFAFVPPQICDALFTAVYPVVSSSKNGKVIIVSTPNGKHNLYYDLWKKATSPNDPDNVDGWKAFRMDWWQIPGRDEKWKQAQIAAIGPTRFAQEFGNEFLDDVTTVKLVPDEIADRYRLRLTENRQRGVRQGKVLSVTSPDGKKSYPFTMYERFDPSRTYLASGDVAEGVKKDASVLYVWDVTDLSDTRIVAKFSKNDVSILEFSFIAKEILAMYANPYLACESNGISLGFIEQLRVTYAYENFIRMNKGGCGIDSNVFRKTKACLWARDMMTTVGFGFELDDAELVDEFSSFVKKDTKVHTVYSALKGAHDDHMMSFVWMCWVLNPENVERYFNVTGTFRSGTGVLFPKTLAPYYGYSPSEVAHIMELPQVKDFAFHEQAHPQEFMRTVAVQPPPPNGVPAVGSAGQQRAVQEPKRSVLSESEMVGFLRGQRNVENQGLGTDEEGNSLGGNGGHAFIVGNSTGSQRSGMLIDDMNVVWQTSDNDDSWGGTVFGHDDFDGPLW